MSGYNGEFRRTLFNAFFETMQRCSTSSDGGTVLIRSAETADALASMIGVIAGMAESLDDPRARKKFMKDIMSRIDATAASARADRRSGKMGDLINIVGTN